MSKPEAHQPVLQASDISLAYEGEVIASHISFSLMQGEVASIVGRSGSGKTTLFHVLAHLSEPLSGEVISHERIGYMFQNDLLLPHKTALDNACLALRIQGERKDQARSQAAKHFAAFGLVGKENAYPSELSGGERQRVAFLRTIMGGERIVLADEPFSALDALTRQSLGAWFVEYIQRQNMSALCVTHDIDEAIFLSDTVYVMRPSNGANSTATLSEPIRINRAGKTRREFVVSPEANAYKRRMLEELEATTQKEKQA